MHLGAVDIIPEWLSFRNEFRSRMKFVLHSYDKLDWRSRSRGFRARSDTHAQQAPRLHDLRFSIGTKFVFSLYDTRKKFRTITRISLGMKTGMNFFSEWLVREQNFVSESKNMIERNILRWNELFPEWKSFRYHENSSLLVHWDNLQNVDFGFQESHEDPAPRNCIFVVLL